MFAAGIEFKGPFTSDTQAEEKFQACQKEKLGAALSIYTTRKGLAIRN